MVIKKQAVISWLLDDSFTEIDKLGIPITPNKEHFGYLSNGFNHLAKVLEMHPNWGLPEFLMPSFEAVMKKSAKAFFNIDHQLFQEFGANEECGILISRDIGTIIYGFGENQLYVWVFNNNDGKSSLYLYFYVESTSDNRRKIYTWPTLAGDPALFNPIPDEDVSIYEVLANKLMIYLAVKKYVQVETIVIPPNTMVKLDDTIFPYKQKGKIKNDSGQEVIIMDSRWFRKIVNDNDIFVRGFFRMQNKKNAYGEWYKELIFVDSFVRHGYHRNAKIEDDIE